MKKWKCNPETRKAIFLAIKYNYRQLKEQGNCDYIGWYYGHAVGNIQAAYMAGLITWELFEKYHDVIYALYSKKKKELTERG